MIWSFSSSKSNFKGLIWSQILIWKNSGGCDGNAKFKNGPEEAYEFLRYLRILRFLDDPNRFVLDIIFSKVVRSLITNVRLKCYKLLMDNVNGHCDWLLVEALSRETKWNWME